MKNVKTFVSMFGKLVKILNRKQKRDGIILFFMLMIVSLLEMLGVGVIVPFIITMLEPEKIMANQYVAPIVSRFNITDYQYFMYMMSAAIILIYILKNIAILGVNYYQCRYRNQLEKDLNVKMMSSYMKRPYTFFLDTNSSEIIRGVNSDIANVATILDSFTSIFAEGLTCLILGIFLICMSPFMAFSLLILVGITSLSIIMGFKKKIAYSGEQCRDAFQEKFKYLYQAVNGVKEIMVANRRDFFVQQYESSSQKAAENNTKYLWISKTPSRIIETVFITGLLIVVSIAYSSADNGIEFVTQLGALGIAAIRILPSVSTLTNSMNSLVYVRPSLEAAYDNITEVEKYDAEHKYEKINKDKKDINFNEQINITDISWKYKEDLPWVLKDLNLVIQKGTSIAVIGESGAGKSTLADVFLGLLKPQQGLIKIDDNDVYSDAGSWAKMIGYVPQSVFLIDDTIRNNIAFGIAEEEIEDDKIWRALEQAQLKQTVDKLEDGLNTIVGERGVKLSGGQRQRIAIARALYHNPDILILDEATSALDSETEEAVMEAIDALHKSKTMIIIAHRLTTIKNCDKIYEIKDGIAWEREKPEVLG